MGRYYTGDIDGKFWFGVQDSNDGEHFGAMASTMVNYYVDDIKEVEEGLKKCRNKLKGFKKKIDKFFKENDSYNSKMLSEYLKVSEDKTKELLVQYARLELGVKIYECVKKEGSCSFDGEQ